MSRPEHELKALEAALSGLTPSAGRLDRDRVLFRAGQKAAPRRWLWPAVAAALVLLSTGLGTALLLRPGAIVVERIVYLKAPPAAKPDEEPPSAFAEAPPSWSRYYQIREAVLTRGLDALPPLEPLPPAPPPERHPLLSPRDY
jgi:hypothetical protein